MTANDTIQTRADIDTTFHLTHSDYAGSVSFWFQGAAVLVTYSGVNDAGQLFNDRVSAESARRTWAALRKDGWIRDWAREAADHIEALAP